MTMHKAGRLVLAILASSAIITIGGCDGSGGFEQALPDPIDNGGGDGDDGGSGDGGDDGDSGDDGDPTGSFGSDFQTIFNTEPFDTPTDPDSITFVNVDFASDPVGVPDPGTN